MLLATKQNYFSLTVQPEIYWNNKDVTVTSVGSDSMDS